MLVPSLRALTLVACTLAAATPAAAQTRDRWREEERARDRRERLEREREAHDRAEAARERARLQARRAAEQRQQQLARRRAERARALREAARRRDDWRDSDRPRLSLGGGLDVRRFGGEGDRFVAQGGVDFRSRSGLGVRPEVVFAWTESRTLTPVPAGCANCLSALPAQLPTGRSRMLGVAVSGTYTLARSSPVRPYLLSGLGVFSTRSPQVEFVSVAPQPQPTLPTAPFQATSRFRNDVDLGLTAGAGLEFDVGPVRLFSEFRYLLTDQPRVNGFGGMLPLTAGLRF